jgi:hypothetical protein
VNVAVSYSGWGGDKMGLVFHHSLSLALKMRFEQVMAILLKARSLIIISSRESREK